MFTSSILDRKILTVFQRMTDFLNDTFGVNNFQIAKFLYMICVVTVLLKMGILIYATKQIFVLTTITYLFGYRLTWRVILKTEQEDSDQQTISPHYIVLSWLRTWTRISLLFIPLFDIPDLLGEDDYIQAITKLGLYNYYVVGLLGTEIGQFVCIYFASCRKPPRKTSKAREFIESLIPRKQTALSVTKAP